MFNVSKYKVKDFGISGVREDLGKDQHDWNKLLGHGRMFPKWLGGIIPGHHWNSKRVGWRYNKKLGIIEYSDYSYIDGTRVVEIISKAEALKLITDLKGINLFPYHGGNRKSTREVTFYFEVEK